MYADATVLFSEDVDDLQPMLDCLHSYTERWNLTVNVDKTKVVVFRKSKRLSLKEHWKYNGSSIEVVDQFCYLGLIFNYNGKFTVAMNKIASQGRKAYYLLNRKKNKNKSC